MKPKKSNSMKTKICQPYTKRPVQSNECFYGITENAVYSECTSAKQNSISVYLKLFMFCAVKLSHQFCK